MAALTTQNIVAAGTAPTFGAAASSDTAEVGNGVNTFAVYKNTNGAVRNLTVVVPGNTSYGSANPDPVIQIAATTGEIWVPLRKEYDAGDGTGRCTLTLDATAGVTVAIVRMG